MNLFYIKYRLVLTGDKSGKIYKDNFRDNYMWHCDIISYKI